MDKKQLEEMREMEIDLLEQISEEMKTILKFADKCGDIALEHGFIHILSMQRDPLSKLIILRLCERKLNA